MRKHLLLSLLCAATLCASASNKYVKPDGDDSLDGKSWANAKATIQNAVWGVPAGDTVFIAEGTYNQTFSVSDGQTILGGYNATTGVRDIEQYVTILDGTNKGKYIIVKYDAPPTSPIVIDGLTFQNAIHTQWGGGAIYMRDNMTVSNCHIINCQGGNAGAIFIDHNSSATVPALVSNCIIELCSAGSSSAAIYNDNGIIENCIIRGCTGPAGAIYNKAGSIVRNCLLHNNTLTGTWPDAAVYNKGQMINCTVCNNYGSEYPGVHSEGDVINCVFWGNQNPSDFSDAPTYINGAGSSHNVADAGFGKSSAYLSTTLNANNLDPAGPNFRNPTNFVGAPTDAGQIAAMQNADFSLTNASVPLLDLGTATGAPATDIDGVTRPQANGIDIGAYEFDPNATIVHVTGLDIVQDTIKVIVGQSGTLSVIITPANANNKRVLWTIDNTSIATISNGAVTGVSIGETIAHAVSQENSAIGDEAIVVILPVPPVKYPDEYYAADSLYHIEDYTVPSFIPFLIAKEGVRIDSLNPESDLSVIPARVAELNTAIANLVDKNQPYNMVANINGDPATHMAFCWFTNEGVNNGVVQLLPMANATENDFATIDGVITVQATATTTPELSYAVATSGIAKAAGIPSNTKYTYVSHKALAENLTPGTAYSWRVGTDGHWSPIAQFRTKDANQGEFSFLYMSDSHIMNAEYVNNARWCATAAAATVPDARFCLFPGDFVETGTNQNSEWEWERWFEESINPVIMKMPIVPTDGNHDDSGNLNYDYHFNTDWGFYSMVQSHKPQFHGITYSFVYGDVLFLVYSLQDWWRASGSSSQDRTSTYLSTDVRNWFLQQIAEHPNTKYRITLAHKNIFSGSGHSVDDEIPMFRDIMLPIFKECQIDLAIQGHDHCYEVIGPVDPDTRTVVPGAVTNVENVPVNTNTNMTGKKNGTFCTDQGTMYFIGATCGRKRYYPYSQAEMIEKYTTDPAILYDDNHHDVLNYFDLFTGMFGQPGAPSFTKFTVRSTGIEVNSYTADSDGNATLINTMQIVRNAVHTGVENVKSAENVKEGEKFIRNNEVLIRVNGEIFNVLGQKVTE